VNSVQSKNARSQPWRPWQDRALIQNANKLRPFDAARGDATRNAWDNFSVDLLKDSALNGTPINRTGEACRARFQKLIKAHKVSDPFTHISAFAEYIKADQTRSLQKTGTDEEVDNHIEVRASKD
jgi:hypothetical protein